MDRPRRNALVEMMDMKEGWVLVFDLDNTITSHYFFEDDEDNKVELNPKMVDILKIACQDRVKGIVSGIFLLTNNSDPHFIQYIHKELCNQILVQNVFDFIMDANHPQRTHMPNFKHIKNGKEKTLADVEFMLTQLKKTTKNLSHRCLFFDDQIHILSEELLKAGKPQHFFHVNPPFTGFEEKKGTRKIRNA